MATGRQKRGKNEGETYKTYIERRALYKKVHPHKTLNNNQEPHDKGKTSGNTSWPADKNKTKNNARR